MKEKIMVVEDERATRDSVGFILLANNYDIIPTSNGMEALEILKECQGMYKDIALIMLDLRMPVMSGSEFLRHTHLLKSVPPVIAMTGCLEDFDLDEPNMTKPAAILPKPFKEDELIAAVESILRN